MKTNIALAQTAKEVLSSKRLKLAQGKSTPVFTNEPEIQDLQVEQAVPSASEWGAITRNVQGATSDGILHGHNGLVVQRKMALGEVGDKYEQEADRLSKAIVHQINNPGFGKQLDDSEAGAKEKAPARQLQSLRPTLQLKGDSSGGSVSPAIESAIDSTRGGGQPLEPRLRQRFGQGMGVDFSGVRVHTDGRADWLNQSLNARAFTTGQDMFFKRGEYQPSCREGQELIAHELTHVLQDPACVYQVQRGEDRSRHGTNRTVDDKGGWAIKHYGARGERWVRMAVDWDHLEKTKGDLYGVPADGSLLYGKVYVAGPNPEGLYTVGTDRDDKKEISLRTWRPKVRFANAREVIRKLREMTGKAQESGLEPDEELAVQDAVTRFRSEWLALEKSVAAEQEDGSGGWSGFVVVNDCYEWAKKLRFLIGESTDVGQVRFDLDDKEKAEPDVQVGDTIVHEYANEQAGSNYHAATVVAKDGGDLITLEAHVEQPLGAPMFAVRHGIEGFVNANNWDPETKMDVRKVNKRAGRVERGGRITREEIKSDLEGIEQGLSAVLALSRETKGKAAAAVARRRVEEIRATSRCIIL